MDFEWIWNNHMVSLVGMDVQHLSRNTHIRVVDVTNEQMTIITSTGEHRNIGKEIFQIAIKELYNRGEITRQEVLAIIQTRVSSAVVAIMATIPGIIVENTTGIKTLKPENIRLEQ